MHMCGACRDVILPGSGGGKAYARLGCAWPALTTTACYEPNMSRHPMRSYCRQWDAAVLAALHAAKAVSVLSFAGAAALETLLGASNLLRVVTHVACDNEHAARVEAAGLWWLIESVLVAACKIVLVRLRATMLTFVLHRRTLQGPTRARSPARDCSDFAAWLSACWPQRGWLAHWLTRHAPQRGTAWRKLRFAGIDRRTIETLPTLRAWAYYARRSKTSNPCLIAAQGKRTRPLLLE